MLQDGVLDASESKELLATLREFSGEERGRGEFLKPTNLPINTPAPDVVWDGRTFCFTGTFSYGTRRQCSELVRSLGGVVRPTVTMKLDYLVLGAYVTPSWMHETFGRKIEKAVNYRDDKGNPIVILSEDHWADQAKAVRVP